MQMSRQLRLARMSSCALFSMVLEDSMLQDVAKCTYVAHLQ